MRDPRGALRWGEVTDRGHHLVVGGVDAVAGQPEDDAGFLAARVEDVDGEPVGGDRREEPRYATAPLGDGRFHVAFDVSGLPEEYQRRVQFVLDDIAAAYGESLGVGAGGDEGDHGAGVDGVLDPGYDWRDDAWSYRDTVLSHGSSPGSASRSGS